MVPGLPGKTAREIWTHLHRTGGLTPFTRGSLQCPTSPRDCRTWPWKAQRGATACASGAAVATRSRPSRSEAPRPYAETRLEDLVVITGYSGAGKSTAMNVFEDAGYFCVDNLPPEMIRALVELFVHEGSKVERAAVVSDVRGGDYFEALRAVLEDLEALGLRHRVLFLDATDDALLTRFQETRRRHPLAPGRRPSSAASPWSARCSSPSRAWPTWSSTPPG